jgi:uncharacterized integral membrane protein
MSDNTPTTPTGPDATPTRQPGEPVPTTEPGTPPDTRGSGRPDKADDPLRGSRTSGLWAGVVALGVVLILLIIFIAQNTTPVDVAFLGWRGRTPLSVALLIATAAGLFLATIAGMLRILQLRRRVRRGERR